MKFLTSGENDYPQFLFDVVVAENLELLQLDVKMAILHSDLKEEIYLD